MNCDKIIMNIQENRIYKRPELIEMLKEEKGGLSENSYVWLIGELVKQGILRHEGRNRYCLENAERKVDYEPIYSTEATYISDKLAKKYPRIGFTVFESFLLNEFLNHQIARNTIFVQTERDTGAFVFNYLREMGEKNVLYRPNKREYSRYWQPGSVVVLDWTSEAPIKPVRPHSITIEKMLVDIFCDKAIQMTYSGAEYGSVVKMAVERYYVDIVRMMRYARRRHRENEIREFIPEKLRL